MVIKTNIDLEFNNVLLFLTQLFVKLILEFKINLEYLI